MLFTSCNQEAGDCLAEFAGTRFEKRAFFDHSKFKRLGIENGEFLTVASFKNIRCDEIELSKCIFVGGADFLDADIDSKSRDSFRLIKNEFQKNNNIVEYTIYRAKELKQYNGSLTWRKNFSEKTVLFLNMISNRYGLSWLKGVTFTIEVSVVFAVFYWSSLGDRPVEFGWAGIDPFIESMNIVFKFLFSILGCIT